MLNFLFRSFSKVPVLMPMDLMVEVSPRRVFANAHTYHVNSISVNSDYETYMSADDLRINLWHLDITDRSFSILCGSQHARIGRRQCRHEREHTCTNTLKSRNRFNKAKDTDNRCLYMLGNQSLPTHVHKTNSHIANPTLLYKEMHKDTRCWGRGILFLRSENVA